MRVAHRTSRTVESKITLPAEPRSPYLARAFASDVLAGLAPASTIDTVRLVVSEIVSNSVQHAASPVELTIRADRSVVHVEARDESSVMPRRRDRPRSDDERGRGLDLLEVLCERHGARRTGVGKTVWCEIATVAARPRRRRNRRRSPER
jgi:anti-sigma regulatory factor (Ser/Thr protein kinase)